jgi:hypothetical protein
MDASMPWIFWWEQNRAWERGIEGAGSRFWEPALRLAIAGNGQFPPGVTSTVPFTKDSPFVSRSASSARAASARSVR